MKPLCQNLACKSCCGFTWWSVVISREFAKLWHGLHQRFCELQQIALDQTLGNLEQLFHHNCNALITQQLASHAEVLWTHESYFQVKFNGNRNSKLSLNTTESAVDCAVGKTELLAAPQVIVAHLRRLVSVHWLGKTQSSSFDESVPEDLYVNSK